MEEIPKAIVEWFAEWVQRPKYSITRPENNEQVTKGEPLAACRVWA